MQKNLQICITCKNNQRKSKKKEEQKISHDCTKKLKTMIPDVNGKAEKTGSSKEDSMTKLDKNI